MKNPEITLFTGFLIATAVAAAQNPTPTDQARQIEAQKEAMRRAARSAAVKIIGVPTLSRLHPIIIMQPPLKKMDQDASLIAIGGGLYVDDALAQAEESVTVSGRESGQLSVLPLVQALPWEWASGIVPVSDLKVSSPVCCSLSFGLVLNNKQ